GAVLCRIAHDSASNRLREMALESRGGPDHRGWRTALLQTRRAEHLERRNVFHRGGAPAVQRYPTLARRPFSPSSLFFLSGALGICTHWRERLGTAPDPRHFWIAHDRCVVSCCRFPLG